MESGMSLSRRHLRRLRDIEADLRSSELRLAGMLDMFTRLEADHQMPEQEHSARRTRRPGRRVRRRADST